MELEGLINREGLVSKSQKTEEIIKRAESLKRPIKIFYGETYDAEDRP